MKRLVYGLAVAVLVMVFQSATMALPRVDELLVQKINASPLGLTPVVITFYNKPASSDFLMLRSLGITGGYKTGALPMVLTLVNKTQLTALKQKSNIRSLYANRILRPLNNESRKFIGVDDLLKDLIVTGLNQGLPVTGKNVGIAYIDTGIDATHPDLKLGENVAQNVFFPTAEIPLNLPSDFLPIVPVENVPISDVEGGHGTFGAGVTAGTGAASGGFYRGVAPGARLVGLTAGNDVGLSTFAILQAMDYALVNQQRYNIRVCNNSYGTTLADNPYSPDDPINTATRLMHDRNITVVFAAGNDGDAPDVINPYSVAPWVVSVAAGEKRGLGTPATFSSRGNDNGTGTDTPGQPADPLAAPNLRPDITGSGVDIKSTRSKAPGVTNVAGSLPVFVGANDLSTISPAYLPYYTTSQGTSFSTPQVSGVVALIMEANPLLTPDEVLTILRRTANPMPYEERVVGAGYVDAHNAVRAALALPGVEYPANLFPVADPNAPTITDAGDDQLGTTAQDIREAKFRYQASTNQIVYTLTLSDLSVRTPNMRWTLTSAFGQTQIFVTASVDEAATTFEYGRITTLATGTENQETLGAVDAGSIDGNTITIKLGLDKINAAVGSSVIGTTSTATKAEAQILIGSSLTGGLLLNSDSATGSNFDVRDDSTNPNPTPSPSPTATPSPSPSPSATPTPTPTPTATPTPASTPTPEPTPVPSNNGRFEERYSDTLNVGEEQVLIPFSVRSANLDAQINQNHGNQQIYFELLDANGNLLAAASNQKILLPNLANGTYIYRVRGSVTKAVDFTIKSSQ